MLEGLHGGMMVVLVDLTVQSLRYVFMTSGFHSFLRDMSIGALVHLCSMALAASELGDGVLCSLHDVCVLMDVSCEYERV